MKGHRHSLFLTVTLTIIGMALVSLCSQTATAFGLELPEVWTLTATWDVPSGAIEPSTRIWVALSEDDMPAPEEIDDAGLALVWWNDTSGWFPVWRISLVSTPDFLSHDGAQAQPSTYLHWTALATTSPPSPGRTYELTLSYDSTHGALGARVMDAMTGSVLVDNGLAVTAGKRFTQPVAKVSGPGSVTVLDVHTDDVFTPIGAFWRLSRVREGQAVLYLTDRNAYVEGNDRLFLELGMVTPATGEWRVVLERGDERRVLSRLSAATHRHELPILTVPEDWVGPFRIQLEYLSNDRVVTSYTAPLIAGRVSVTFAAADYDRESGAAKAQLQIESTAPLVTNLTVSAALSEVVWSTSSLRYEEVPLTDHPVRFHLPIDLTSGHLATAVPLDIPLPERPSTFRVRYHVAHDLPFEVAFQVVQDRDVIHTHQGEIEFTVVTYNLFGRNDWPRRAPALEAVIEAMQPDILGLQEFRIEHREVLDRVLPHHERVTDSFIGWLSEGNIYWSGELFDLVEYGAREIGICEPWRRLFWVRLQPKGSDRTLLVGNAHYTWDGHECIQNRGQILRVHMAQATLDVLNDLARPGEPVIFMGDLNESGPAIQTLREGGLRDSVGTTGEQVRHTYPADPLTTSYRGIIDWQFHSGPIWVVESGPVDFSLGNIVPSDHKPVLARYRM